MGANLNDNNAKLDNLEKAIKAANERRRKLIEKNKLITYDALSDLYGKEGQELIDAVTAEHNTKFQIFLNRQNSLRQNDETAFSAI